MFYVNQSDIENYLNISLTGNGLNLFTALQQNVQDTVDQFCNRSWNFTNPVTEYHNSFENSSPSRIKDTFFTKAPVSITPYNASFPQAGGVRSIIIVALNGVGGQPV